MDGTFQKYTVCTVVPAELLETTREKQFQVFFGLGWLVGWLVGFGRFSGAHDFPQLPEE